MQTFYKLLLNVLMLLFLYNNSVKAQSGITVKAVYKSKLSFVETMNDSIKQSMIENMGPPQMFDVYFKAIKNAGEGEFILSLNSNESVFKRRRILQTPNPNNGEISINIQSTSSLVKNVYKNNIEKYMLIEDNIRGKIFSK
nr:hypothetical protein [Nonlabens ulvanivorans]